MKNWGKKIYWPALIVIVFILGIFVGNFISAKKYTSFIDSIHLVRSDITQYPFVHPLVGFQTPNALNIDQFSSMAGLVKKSLSGNRFVLRYSVYFRDFNSGLWFGINENDTYSPASMLKVPFAMAAYKQQEANPNFLNEYKTYTSVLANINKEDPLNASSSLVVGQAYTIKDSIKKMIVDSDNGAKDILGNSIDKKIIDGVYENLGIGVPPDEGEYLISPKQYIQFFRTLYGGTYLSDANSNELLKLLADASFTKGLAGGVPKDILVAHKFGEHIVTTDNSLNSTELSDCGIVYHPKHPYLLCIMTQGKDETDLAEAISDASKIIYNEVDKDYK